MPLGGIVDKAEISKSLLIPSTMKGGAEQKGLYIQIMLGVNSNRRTALRGLLAICR